MFHCHTSIVPARWSRVEFRPSSSRQLMFSGVSSFLILSRSPFLAASNSAESPRRRSARSPSCSLTRSRAVRLSLLRRLMSAPCWRKEKMECGVMYRLKCIESVGGNSKYIVLVSAYKTVME